MGSDEEKENTLLQHTNAVYLLDQSRMFSDQVREIEEGGGR